jgi:hypothetical protein
MHLSPPELGLFLKRPKKRDVASFRLHRFESRPTQTDEEILCTPWGQVAWAGITTSASRTGSTQVRDGKATKVYFTKIVMTKISGEEFDKAFQTFHADFEDGQARGIPELTSASGR